MRLMGIKLLPDLQKLKYIVPLELIDKENGENGENGTRQECRHTIFMIEMN